MHTGAKECSHCGHICSGKEGLARHMAECHPSIQQANPPKEPTHREQVQAAHQIASAHSPASLPVTPRVVQQVADARYAATVAAAIPTALPTTPVAAAAATPVSASSRRANSRTLFTNTGGNSSAFNIEVVFKCEFCSGTFSTQSSLDQHIRMYHLELQDAVTGTVLLGTEAMIRHIQANHQPNKVRFD